MVAALRPVLGDRPRLVRAAFDDAVATAVGALAEPEAALPGGARLSVHQTPALTAIDVDLGAATAARGGKARTQFAANRALLPGLARQIRLRNLSGAILVDLGGVAASRRVRLGPELQAALSADPLAPRLLGFTVLGLAESCARACIRRYRTRYPARTPLGSQPCAPPTRRWQRVRTARRPLRAAPAVDAALRADPVALSDWQRRTGRSFPVRPDPTLPACAWSLDA